MSAYRLQRHPVASRVYLAEVAGDRYVVRRLKGAPAVPTEWAAICTVGESQSFRRPTLREIRRPPPTVRERGV